MSRLIANTILLLIPFLCFYGVQRKESRRTFLVFSPLLAITSAFAAFLAASYLLGNVAVWQLWLLYFVASGICGVLMTYSICGPGGLKARQPWTRREKIGAAAFAAALLVVLAGWHYVGSSSSAMYYIWMDVCRYWADTGHVYPPLPPENPSGSFLVGLVYSPALLSALLLLTSGLEKAYYFNAFGILLWMCHVGLLLAMMECGNRLFARAWIGAFAYVFCLVSDPWSKSLVSVQLMVGSHYSSLYYSAALLLLTFLYAWDDDSSTPLALYVWTALSALSMRPYLGPYAISVGAALIVLTVFKFRRGRFQLGELWQRPYRIGSGLLLGIVVFSWQLMLLAKYGSLVVYDPKIMLANHTHYVERGSDLASRASIYFGNIIESFFHPVARLCVKSGLCESQTAVGNYEMLAFGVVLMFLVTSIVIGIRTFRRGAWLKHIGTYMFIMVVVFSVTCLVINVDSWNVFTSTSVLICLVAAAWPLFLLRSRRNIAWMLMMVYAMISGALFLMPRHLTYVQAAIASEAAVPTKDAPSRYMSMRSEDDRFREQAAQFLQGVGGKILLIRVEPGADVVFELSGQYYWTQRFLWNDCDDIMESLNWDPQSVAERLLAEDIRWVLQPAEWSLDNHAGLTVLGNMRKMMENRPDVFPVTLQGSLSRRHATLYAVKSPGAK